MPCYRPIKGWRSKDVNPSGKRSIVFTLQEAYKDFPVDLPCGQCIGCRLERSRRWAVRIMHENQMHERSCFLTLTYSPENLPPDGTLVLKHFQDFMKRLRERVGIPLRFFHCGEYGTEFSRPHYHCILFGYDFSDKVKCEETHDGFSLESSKFLEEIWGLGHCRIGSVSFESAAYVARYITKKITGELAHVVYNDIDESTGEILRELRPEYVTMSRRPGIGHSWFAKFKSDVFPDDFVLVRRGGKMVKVSVPKYYDQLLEKEDEFFYKSLVAIRKNRAEDNADNNTPERLQTRERIHRKKAQQLKRKYEDG